MERSEEQVEVIEFEPVYQERVWGGRELERRFGRRLPDDGRKFGESWEVVDRPEAQSVVAGGRFEGLTLGELWARQRAAVFGEGWGGGERFPVLVKVLDARERLSVQVHPPRETAGELGGEEKSEMWLVVGAEPGAELFVGLKRGVERGAFERAIGDGGVEGMLHRVPVVAGTVVDVPSGRLHAIGAGCLIFEVQQNSDTTYRVYDWGRMGTDGKPRALHVREAMQCIDFADFEPGVAGGPGDDVALSNETFRTDVWNLGFGERREVAAGGEAVVVAVGRGEVRCGGKRFGAGSFFLVSAGGRDGAAVVEAAGDALVLRARGPRLRRG